MIHKAECHIDHCGGPINVMMLNNTGCGELSVDEYGKPNSGDGKERKTNAKLHYSESFFLLAHLALTALRADSLRCSGVIAAALATPPFFPPFFPNFAR
jgi:hypothetical protein